MSRSFVPSPPRTGPLEYGFTSQAHTWDVSQSLFDEVYPPLKKTVPPFGGEGFLDTNQLTVSYDTPAVPEFGDEPTIDPTQFQSPALFHNNGPLPHEADIPTLRSVDEIPERYRGVFSYFTHFNRVQSIIFDDVLYSDRALVTSAPTGSGKTVLFELAIVRLLIQMGDDLSRVKIVYVAPIKALCAERCDDWSTKFGPLGLKCSELTGDSQLDDYYELQSAHIITTTPEKWDSMTRKWRDNKSLVQMVQLFLIDEIHQLNDTTRGPTMEAIVCRMKTVRASVAWERNGTTHTAATPGATVPLLRFIAVSATIPNINDVAVWLGSEECPAVSHSIDESCRPVKLRRVVLSYPSSSSDYKFDLSLNYKLSNVIQCYSDHKPTLVFCATRKGTQQAAAILVKDARFIMNIDHKRKLQSVAVLINDSKLRDIVSFGVGYHHAGMSMNDRKHIEAVFCNGELPVLFSTSTLAMGVNLPAHLVVVKSTMHYVNGSFEEYSESQILQMIGRAGRPQFDTSATAVIMTRNTTKDKYDALLGGTQLVESNLHANLIEHLNAEIVLQTITDVSIALDWLKSTFLFTRIKQNPKHYGIPEDLPNDALQGKLQEMCLENLKQLEAVGLLNMDDGFTLIPTDTGKLMARYYVAFESMKIFLQLNNCDSLSQLVEELSKCKEFKDVHLRVNEKKALNQLNKDKNRQTIRFPMSGRIKSTDMKVNCLIQAVLGSLSVQEFSLNQDTQKIFRSASRLSKCLMEIQMLGSNYSSLLNSTLLHKCISARLWENSKHVARQLDKIGVALSTILVNAGLTTFDKIIEKNPRELELIVNRHPPFGNQVKESASKMPRYKLEIEQSSPYFPDRGNLSISVTLINHNNLRGRGSTAGLNHGCLLIIGNKDNEIIMKHRINDSQLLTTGKWHRQVTVNRCSKGPELTAHLISLHYVGIDAQDSITLQFTPSNDGRWSSFKQQHGCDKQQPTTSKSSISSNSTDIALAGGEGNNDKTTVCGHRCLNKSVCGHTCCKTGVQTKSKTTSNRSMSTPSLNQSSLKPAPLLAKHATSTPSGSNMYKTTGNVSAHVNEVYRTPQSTPGPKISANEGCTRSTTSVIRQYQYTPKPSLSYNGLEPPNTSNASIDYSNETSYAQQSSFDKEFDDFDEMMLYEDFEDCNNMEQDLNEDDDDSIESTVTLSASPPPLPPPICLKEDNSSELFRPNTSTCSKGVLNHVHHVHRLANSGINKENVYESNTPKRARFSVTRDKERDVTPVPPLGNRVTNIPRQYQHCVSHPSRYASNLTYQTPFKEKQRALQTTSSDFQYTSNPTTTHSSCINNQATSSDFQYGNHNPSSSIANNAVPSLNSHSSLINTRTVVTHQGHSMPDHTVNRFHPNGSSSQTNVAAVEDMNRFFIAPSKPSTAATAGGSLYTKSSAAASEDNDIFSSVFAGIF